LICHHTPFFSAAFNSNFKEGITQEMAIDVDLEAFGLFVTGFTIRLSLVPAKSNLTCPLWFIYGSLLIEY
jgi:hypothetical protein